MEPSLWRRVALSRPGRESLAGWRVRLGEGFEAVRPFLRECPGVRAAGYPCPRTGLRLTVRESGEGFVAFATDDDAEDFEDLRLEWKDVQAWRLDTAAFGDGVRSALGLEAGRESGKCEVESGKRGSGTGNSKLESGQDAGFSLNAGRPEGTGAGAAGNGMPEGMEIGVCRRDGRRRRVLMCLAGRAEEATAAALAAGAVEGAGCLLIPERYVGVREILKARGVAEVPMEECLRVEGGRLCGDCGGACGELETSGVTHETLRDTMVEGFGSLKRERIEDAMKAQAQTATIGDMAQGPDKFLAGLNARMSEEERALFFELIGRIESEGRMRSRTYAEIGTRMGGITRQAVGLRVRDLYERLPTVRAYVETERARTKEMAFSRGTPSWRRKMGVDEAYGRGSGRK